MTEEWNFSFNSHEGNRVIAMYELSAQKAAVIVEALNRVDDELKSEEGYHPYDARLVSRTRDHWSGIMGDWEEV